MTSHDSTAAHLAASFGTRDIRRVVRFACVYLLAMFVPGGCAPGVNTASVPVVTLPSRPTHRAVRVALQRALELATRCIDPTQGTLTVHGAFMGATGTFAVRRIDSEEPLTPSIDTCVRNAFRSARVDPFDRAVYRVRRHFDARGAATAPAVETAAATSAPPAPDAQRAPTALAIPSVARGALDDLDWRLSDGSIYDDYLLTLAAGEAVTIVVRRGEGSTTAFDPSAYVLRNDREITRDDDSAGGGNVRIVFAPRLEGSYVLRVRAARRGRYVIETWHGELIDAR